MDMDAAYPLDTGFSYRRSGEPDCAALEDELSRVYGAERVVITNSGMEAITTMFDWVLPVSGKIVINKNLYHETRLWLKLIRRHETVSVDMEDLEALAAAARNANIVYLDFPGVFPHKCNLAEIEKIVHTNGAALCVDNSVASFNYVNPLKAGADYVVESYSKYVTGGNDTMAGAIAIRKVRNKARLNAFLSWRGRSIHPITVHQIRKGIETLPIRMERIQTSASALDEALKRSGFNCLYNGYGCIMLPGYDDRLCKRLRMFKTRTTFGANVSICTASYRPDLYDFGQSYVRLSVGLENNSMLIQDVLRAAKEVKVNE